MRTITCRFEFSSAHQLSGLREGHKCARMHGHNYVVDLTLAPKGTDLRNGFVCDAEDARTSVQPIITRLDHYILNEALDDGTRHGKLAAAQPTIENIAMYLWHRLGFMRNGPHYMLTNVRVYENKRLWADWSEDVA